MDAVVGGYAGDDAKSLSENVLPSPRLRGEGPGVRGFGIGTKSLFGRVPRPRRVPLLDHRN